MITSEGKTARHHFVTNLNRHQTEAGQADNNVIRYRAGRVYD